MLGRIIEDMIAEQTDAVAVAKHDIYEFPLTQGLPRFLSKAEIEDAFKLLYPAGTKFFAYKSADDNFHRWYTEFAFGGYIHGRGFEKHLVITKGQVKGIDDGKC